jgi:hypothetical protein
MIYQYQALYTLYTRPARRDEHAQERRCDVCGENSRRCATAKKKAKIKGSLIPSISSTDCHCSLFLSYLFLTSSLRLASFFAIFLALNIVVGVISYYEHSLSSSPHDHTTAR